MSLLSTLQESGLKEKESQVYLSLLELGPSLVSTVGRKAKINRVTAYHVLEKLMDKGYVTQFTQEGVKYFSSVDPVLIVEQINQKAKKLTNALQELKNIQNLYQKKTRTHHFQGLRGIKAMYQDTLMSKGTILNFSYSQKIIEQWPEYENEYIEQRIKKKIPIKCIVPEEQIGEMRKQTDEFALRETRIVSEKEFPLACEINIYESKTAFVSFEPDDLFGIIIENQNFTDSHKYMFQMAWKFAENYEREHRKIVSKQPGINNQHGTLPDLHTENLS
jgi:sugar-specific transcriptional regulator TrmB